MFPYFQNHEEFVASYICCLVAEYTAIYNYKKEDNVELYDSCDYDGQLYMEDLFLRALYAVENYSILKGDNDEN